MGASAAAAEPTEREADGLARRVDRPRGAAAADPPGREADGLARRLDRPMSVLGLVFVLVVLGQSLAREPWLVTTLTVVGWLLWAVFVAEFALRALRASDQRRFWSRNWWQL